MFIIALSITLSTLILISIRKDFGSMNKQPSSPYDVIYGDIHAPIINKESIMGKFWAFVIGFLLASSLGLMVTLSYFLFCPHAVHIPPKTIIITPPELLPNPMVPEIPNGPAPLELGT